MARGIKRVLIPNRNQLGPWASDLESLVPEGHRARLVWAYVIQAVDVRRLRRNSCSGCGCTLGSKGRAQASHHTPSNFRGKHGDTLDALPTDSVAALLAAKTVKLKRVAQEGYGSGPVPAHPGNTPALPCHHLIFSASYFRSSSTAGWPK